MRRVDAPWSAEFVDALNRFQVSGIFHPFTCATHSQDDPLIAKEDGWHCPHPSCDYRQFWAHAEMAEIMDPPLQGECLVCDVAHGKIR